MQKSAANIFATSIENQDATGWGLEIRTAGVSSSRNALEVYTGGVSKFLVRQDGNVGIGTTSPTKTFTVSGQAYIQSGGTVATDLNLDGLMISNGGNSNSNRALRIVTNSGGIEALTVTNAGNVGIGTTSPSHPLHMGSGAHVTTGGVWTNASSREYKEDIATLEAEEALETLNALEPVKYKYKNAREEKHIGFIAEDVPDLVATKDRKGLSSMDIVAVLTKVVQQQQKRIEALEAKLNKKQ